MKKIYQLQNLDCANCAMKIEKRVRKVSGVIDVNVDFISRKMFVEEDNAKFEEIVNTIQAVEPEIKIIALDVNEKKLAKQATQEHGACTCEDEEHTHDNCCGHHHEEHTHDGCSSGDEEHTHDGCCGHHHEEHTHDSCTCGDEEHTHDNCCGHHHEEHTHDGCTCGDEEHTHDNCCGHHREEHTHDGCSCGQPHEEQEKKELRNAQRLYIQGLDCANCANKIETYVAHMENVEDASLNFSNGVLFVELKNKAKLEETIQAILNVVPTLEDGIVIKRDKNMNTTGQSERKYAMFSFSRNWSLYLGMLFFVVGIILEPEAYSVWIFLLAYVLAGGKVVLTAIKNVIRGEVFDENFLMSVATIGAFCIQDFKEAVAVMIFYEIGEMFQSYAVNKSRKSISSLMDIRADYANVLMDGKIKKCQPEEVEIGVTILVKPGERVPLDGIVVDGFSSLDTSALTGESLPRDVERGEEILAGVVNLSGVLHIQVTKEYGESCVARILELVENASSKKAPMEKYITKFARVYTPIVVSLAIALAILPVLFIEGSEFTQTLESALTFLVVSCPCALVVSVPLGLFAGIGTASKRGILIKGGNYLEALKDVDTVVFDKTGTLTKGVFKVVDIYAVNDTPQNLLKLAAQGEFYSSHPIALSIKEAYGKEIDAGVLKDYEEVAGNGVHVKIDGLDVLLGNHKLMDAYQIEYRDPQALGTIIHVAIQNEYAGYLVIDDEIKETSKDAISALKENGVSKIVMLSGDRRAVGEHVASLLGLDEVHMQLLPVDKVEKVEALLAHQKEGKKLAFVGDGINDAPVLARADVGVAMGGVGSDAAIEAADIVLMKDDPKALSTAISIAKKTMRILWQNIAFSLGVKILIMILAVFGFANMWMGVFADVGVTLLAVLNSMRVLRMKGE